MPFLFFKNPKLIPCESISSTNKLAWEKLKNNEAQHGDIILANYQTQGKGQTNNSWFSSPGANILMSVICKDLNLPAAQLPKFNMLVSLAVHHFISFYFPKSTHIKWPNDILINSKKVAGILIETSLQGEAVKNAVIGIGINVNEEKFPLGLEHAASFFTLSLKHYPMLDLVNQLIVNLDTQLFKLKTMEIDDLISVYNSKLFGMDVKRYFRKDNFTFEGIIKGVNSHGQLRIETENQLQLFNNKEIEFVF
jgi:BirA family biotin operon repressor/biotin-[acetyl-CoA-carboxylase] ligase